MADCFSMTRGAPYRFQNINYRVNTQFVMFTGGVNTNTLQTPNYNIIAQSPIIVNVAPNQPVQVCMPCHAQPALALLEMVQYEHMRSKGLTTPDVLFAGHSLGEYAALGACSSFMTFENLLSLVFYRGLKMQNALERDSNGLTDFSMMATDPSRVGKGMFTLMLPTR